LKGAIEGIRPLGKTPISYSLRQALEDFGDRSGDIILISDGIETCDEDPCALVREWRARDIGISVHVVGLGLEEKAKGAMRCIAEAAGTEYQDADSGATLAAGLSKIQEQTTAASLFLVGTDSAGERLRIRGTIEDAEAETTAVSSERRNVVASGEYTLTVGVETRNGNLYRPVSRRITVAPAGRTTVEVEVARPPSVRARFLEEGQEQTGALVHVSQDDREVFTFRHIDEVFVDEGTYEFRSTPNAENELSVTAAIATGERKEVVFEMVKTVHVYVTMAASGSGIVFRQNYELLQGGGKRYRVHQTNGARVLPGTYDLRLPDRLTPYVRLLGG